MRLLLDTNVLSELLRNEFDAQIAAIAMHQQCAVATRNVDDFADCHVAVIDPWQASH